MSNQQGPAMAIGRYVKDVDERKQGHSPDTAGGVSVHGSVK